MKATVQLKEKTPTSLQQDEEDITEQINDESNTPEQSAQELIQSHPEVEPILEKLNPKEQQVISTIIREERFSGPIPHPKHLKAYADIYPDAPQKIFAMAEKQQEHRISMEKSGMDKHFRYITTGMYLGFILAAIFLIGGLVLIALDKQVIGISIIASVMVGLVTMFVLRKEKTEPANNNSEEEANKQNSEEVPSE